MVGYKPDTHDGILYGPSEISAGVSISKSKLFLKRKYSITRGMHYMYRKMNIKRVSHCAVV